MPDGVIDDRFGIKHSDFTSPEYEKLDQISEKKWEECRGLGRSFGYNRAEGENETIAPGDLIALLVDIVSKNGNLLLDVGPEADGTIPPVQMERLQGARRLAQAERRSHLRHNAVDAGGREVRGRRRSAVHAQGRRSVRDGAGQAEGANVDDLQIFRSKGANRQSHNLEIDSGA